MEEFAVTCPLVPGASRLISGFCSSPRNFGLDFLVYLAIGLAYEVTRHARHTRLSSWARRGLIAQRPLQHRFSSQIGKLRGRLYTGTVMVPLWLEKAMPTTLTLKNIPDEVYERLKAAAEAHRRSLNSEAIVCLETVLTPTKIAPSERLARARQLRAGLSTTKFRACDIDTLKRQGRS